MAALWVVAPAAAAAKPFVSVQASLKRGRGLPTVHAHVEWDGSAAREEPDEMKIGNLRLLAVSDDGHHPTVLATDTYRRIDQDATQDVVLYVDKKDKDAIDPGNRVVLTASQHGVTPGATRSVKTFVTVDQLQPFGSKQDRVGRRDCADVAIVPGARLDECDLVGAYLDQAQVSMRRPKGRSTEMRLADLTGATMEDADLGGLNLAGGRANGADAAGAVIDNLALSGAEATRLDARGVQSLDPTGGADIYDSRLREARFQGAELNGVSFDHSDLDGANFDHATWQGVHASTASFRGAELGGLQGGGGNVYFTDFTDAKMRGAPFSDADLEWSILCHTLLPDGKLEDRDCHAKVDPGPPPAANPKVKVTASLTRSEGSATISGTIAWNSAATRYMPVGEIRVLAIDGPTGIPTTIAEETYEQGHPPTTPFDKTVTDPAQLKALQDGNRVVLTATQHPLPPRSGRTNGSYVTVDTLQAGPGRGRVGSRDCSELTIAPSAAEGSLQFCDLAGAVLTEASLSGSMRDSDLTGAELQGAGMGGVELDGSALGGADMSNLEGEGIRMLDVSAPRVDLAESALKGAVMNASDFDGANFDHASIEGILASSLLRGAKFTSATLIHADLGFARLNDAKLDKVKATVSSLFLADLANATLADSRWTLDESLEPPWEWATLCHTTLPEGAKPSGDRDCPR